VSGAQGAARVDFIEFNRVTPPLIPVARIGLCCGAPKIFPMWAFTTPGWHAVRLYILNLGVLAQARRLTFISACYQFVSHSWRQTCVDADVVKTPRIQAIVPGACISIEGQTSLILTLLLQLHRFL